MNSNSDAKPFAWYIFFWTYFFLTANLEIFHKNEEKKDHDMIWVLLFLEPFFRGADFIDCYY